MIWARTGTLLPSLGLRQLGKPGSDVGHWSGVARNSRISGGSGFTSSTWSSCASSWASGSVALIWSHRSCFHVRFSFWTDSTALSQRDVLVITLHIRTQNPAATVVVTNVSLAVYVALAARTLSAVIGLKTFTISVGLALELATGAIARVRVIWFIFERFRDDWVRSFTVIIIGRIVGGRVIVRRAVILWLGLRVRLSPEACEDHQGHRHRP